MYTLMQDLRYGARMLFRKPGVTIIAILALALGIGANTAIFSVVHALLLKPFSFPELKRIVTVWDESQRNPHNEVAVGNYLDWQAQAQSYEHLPLGQSNSSSSFLLEGIPEPPPGQSFNGRNRICMPEYFQALGITLSS